MKTFLLTLALVVSSLSLAPCSAQSKPLAVRADPCAPIGRTADGQLVYGMKCDNLPVPPPSAVRSDVRGAVTPAPVEEEDKGGLFRNPFPSLIRPSNVERTPGVGPAGAR